MDNHVKAKVGDLILYKSHENNGPDKLYRVTAVHEADWLRGSSKSVVGVLVKQYKNGAWLDVPEGRKQQIYWWNGYVVGANTEALATYYKNTLAMLESLKPST